jgi:hypothetical protein
LVLIVCARPTKGRSSASSIMLILAIRGVKIKQLLQSEY